MPSPHAARAAELRRPLDTNEDEARRATLLALGTAIKQCVLSLESSMGVMIPPHTLRPN